MPESPCVELDHIILLCAPGAPEAAVLIRNGLQEGSPNVHPGQGTACRRFFFEGAYLELVWVADAEEAQREPGRATGLWEHWSNRTAGACPFGLVLRPAPSAERVAPFVTWAYRPQYLPPSLAIEVAAGTQIDEPLLFYLTFQGRRPRSTEQPTTHAIPLGEVTQVSIGRPAVARPSAAMAVAQTFEWLTVQRAPEHVVEVTFDSGRSRQTSDLRPEAPVILRW